MLVPEISPQELREELDGPRPPVLLDVREEEELTISRLPGAVHIPLADLPDRVHELDADSDFVVFCRAGVRSAYATAYLGQMGFRSVRNLATGINGWTRDVDPSQAEY